MNIKKRMAISHVHRRCSSTATPTTGNDIWHKPPFPTQKAIKGHWRALLPGAMEAPTISSTGLSTRNVAAKSRVLSASFFPVNFADCSAMLQTSQQAVC